MPDRTGNAQACGCDFNVRRHGVLTPHLCAEHESLRETQSKRTFYRTEFRVIVLSEEPLATDADLQSVAREAVEGDYSWDYSQTSNDAVEACVMARMLEDQGSDPEFFELLPDGQDSDE